MRMDQVICILLLISICTVAQDCKQDPYDPISELELGHLKGLLARYVRPMPANEFGKQRPRTVNLRQRVAPVPGTSNLGFDDDGAFLSTPTTAEGGNPNGLDQKSISERIYSRWCTVVTNTCVPEAESQGKIAGLLWMVVNHGEPEDQNIRRNAILQMLKEIQVAGAITFNDVFGLTKMKSEPPVPGPKDNITLNVATKWRNDILPPGTLPQKIYITKFAAPTQQAPSPPPKRPTKPPHRRHDPPTPNHHLRSLQRHSLHRRDDSSDNFCFPQSSTDWHILLQQLFSAIVLERMAPSSPQDSDPSKSPTAIELDIVHPGYGGKYDIVAGGQVRIKFWLSSEGPDLNGLGGAYFDKAPDSFADEGPFGGGSDHQTCYENYIVAGAVPDSPGPSDAWKRAYADACNRAFRAGSPDEAILPKPFQFSGPGPDTKGNDGKGWLGEFIPDSDYKEQYSCEELMEALEEHLAFCVGRVQNKGRIYHGGITHLTTVNVKEGGSKNCGAQRFEPVGLNFTDAF